MSRISILKKSGLSLCILLVCLMWLICIQLVRDMKDNEADLSRNSTVHCVLKDNTKLPYDGWLIGPSMMAGIGEFSLLLTCIEFVSAQAPYSMRGILFGFVHIGIGFSVFSIYILTLVFEHVISWEGVALDCGFGFCWFLL